MPSRKERIRKTEEGEGGEVALCNPGDRGMVICHPLVRFCARDRDREREGRDTEQGILSGETSYEFSLEKYCKSSGNLN